MRGDREDWSHQIDKVADAQKALHEALTNLSNAARLCARLQVPIERVYGCVGQVKRAEEELDLAQLDLQTARGEDA